MKNKRKLFISVSIVLTFCVGFLVGLLIEYPKINNQEISGTIAKVDNYRNVKVTEADIELKNELVADPSMQKATTNYLTFYYTQSMEFGKSIAYTVEQAKAIETFNAAHESQITALESYGKFLEETRKELLLSKIVCESLGASSPLMIRNAIARANNIISQMSYRNSTLIGFIDSLDAFIVQNGTTKYPELNKAHSLLLHNQVGASLATNNKVLLKYFDKKQMYASNIASPASNAKEVFIGDLEALNVMLPAYMDQMGLMDVEKLGLVDDKEQLGEHYCWMCDINDIETLGMVFDAEKLGAGYTDSESLGAVLRDSEILGALYFDSEKLGAVYAQ